MKDATASSGADAFWLSVSHSLRSFVERWSRMQCSNNADVSSARFRNPRFNKTILSGLRGNFSGKTHVCGVQLLCMDGVLPSMAAGVRTR